MNGEIGKDEVVIGSDEEGLYFEAGSEEAVYAFIGLLRGGAAGAIAYVETHTVTYEEVEVDMAEVGMKKGIKTNRTELIHMITNLIEDAGVTVIEDRDDANMLAISIVDGLEDEAERRTLREVAVTVTLPLTCPKCGAVQEGSMFSGVADHMLITCKACHGVASWIEFRTAEAGDEEAGK